LTIYLFGKFRAECNQQILEDLPGGKASELFVYLLLNQGRKHRREKLAALLWPDCTTEKSKRYLRQALWKLQSALNSAPEGHKPEPLSMDTESLQLNEGNGLTVDVADFEAAYHRTKAYHGYQLDPAQAEALGAAVSLYRGDLLEGWYQDWCLIERERLQNCYLCMLDQLIDYCRKSLDYRNGVEYGERILRLDRGHERTHQQLMRLHYCCGYRAEALRQFQRCQTALQEELGVRPSHLTFQLYEDICKDENVGSTRHSLLSPSLESFETGEELQDLLAFVGKIEVEIKRKLQAIERATPCSKISRCIPLSATARQFQPFAKK
jgi:DNA-binding SARP family transcriptional activator